MVQLKRSQIRLIEQAVAFPQGFGYVLDFSDRTISEFFEDEFGIDFDHPKYVENGTSKRNRLTTFIAIEDAYTVAKVLRALWDRREGLIQRQGGNVDNTAEEETKRIFLDIISGVEGRSEIPRTDALDRYARDRTLDELIRDIERDLQANKPEAAMDHLHTYCMKKFAHLLRTRGIDCGDNEPLHARFGKYRMELLKERDLTHLLIDHLRPRSVYSKVITISAIITLLHTITQFSNRLRRATCSIRSAQFWSFSGRWKLDDTRNSYQFFLDEAGAESCENRLSRH